MSEAPKDKKNGVNLSSQVMWGLLVGLVAGVVFGELITWLRPVGDIFIKLLQITVIPYISFSLITALGQLSLDEVKRLALRGGSVLLVAWLITLGLILLVPLSFPDWPSASFFSKTLVEEAAPPDFLRLFIPSNPFFSYANAIVPAVVVFSILLGLTLIAVPNKHAVLDPLLVLRSALVRITEMIARLAPIGVFALTAHAVGTIDIEDLARLQVFIVIYILLSIVLALWVFPGLIALVTPLRHRDILRALRTPLITALATGSALVVLPLLIERCKRLIAEAELFDTLANEDAASSVEVLIPGFFTFPNPGTLLALAFVMFSGWYIGSGLSAADYLPLMLVGVPTLFGGTLLAIPFLLDFMRLPSDLFNVFVTVDVITSRFGTLLAVAYYAAIGLIGAIATVGALTFDWTRVLRFALISSVAFAVVLTGTHNFYTHLVVAPYTKADVLRSLHLLDEPRPATVVDTAPAVSLKEGQGPATLAEILDRGILRVCFQPEEYPSAFYNTEDPPQLVGFDIEMAHRLATRLLVDLEFLPAADQVTAAQYLDHGLCDIYMRTLPITTRKTEIFTLTNPVYRSSIGLIVRDHRREEFRTWTGIRELGDSVRLAFEDNPASRERFRSHFPEAQMAIITDMQDQRRLLESGAEGVDGIFDMSEEAAAWTVLYPSFALVVPRPTRFIPVAYAVAKENDRLLAAVNAWLIIEEAEGNIDALYAHWMLGEAAKAERPPRWSVIRNVLGWVD